MRLGEHRAPATAALLCALFAGCSGGGGSSTSANTIQSVVQDLGQDPSGATTVITFASDAGLAAAGAGSFESDGGQTPVLVNASGDTVTVVWDTYVPPSNHVRAVGLEGVAGGYADVTTSDASSPTISSATGTQGSGLGADVLQVQFDGTWVAASEVQDASRWTLAVNGVTLDLAGSTFDFDAPSQTLTIDLGPSANLHANFELTATGLHGVNDADVAATPVAGTASGDTLAPALLAAEQNLGADEYGRVVDFTFSEAMDPVFSVGLAHFSAALPDTATSVEQVGPDVLRVSFSNPMVPGVDTVTLTGLVDAHGNALPDGATALTQPQPVANAFASAPQANTVQNQGGDTITVVTTQALDPDSAADPAAWTLDVAGAPVDLSAQELDYDLLSKTLTIRLSFDLRNGDAFDIAGVAALDVDGETFTGSASGSAAGDATAPTVTAITQNRNVDPTGRTLDVQFSEDVDEATAETAGSYAYSGAQGLVSATRLAGLDAVRLVYDAAVVPGDGRFSVSGVLDLAGNAMPPQAGIAIGSTDTAAPNATGATAQALAGADNDTLDVTFDDDLVEAEVEDPSNWTCESPVGTVVASAGATVAWSAATRTARLTFTNGVDLQAGDDFQVAFANLRDLGGNTVGAGTVGGAIAAETVLPRVHTVVRDGVSANVLHVRFSEPCANLQDLYDASTNPAGTRYLLRDSNGALRGAPVSATAVDDGLGADLTFAVSIAAADTLDVIGATDRCGNPLVPALLVATQAEDAAQPALDALATTCTAIAGESNDQIHVVFDRPMSPWSLLDAAHYTITGPSGPVTLTTSQLSFDGNATVTIGLRSAQGNNLQAGGSYSVTVGGVWSAQGAQLSGTDTVAGLSAGGDTVAPAVAVGDVRLDPQDPNSLLILASETVDVTAASVAANYDLGGGNLATSAQRVSPRAIRATFGAAPVVGDTLTLTVTDLAGNVSGSISRAVAAADATAPLIVAVTGAIVSGYGGDYVDVTFDEPVGGATLQVGSWTITSNGTALALTGARVTYLGSTDTVRLYLPPTSDLDANGQVAVTVTGATDLSGNAFPGTANASGTVSGDLQAPSILSAFVNWREDPTGATVEVVFDEEVDAAVAGLPTSWSASSGPTVQAVQAVTRDHYRLTLSAPLGAAGTLGIGAISDAAHNVSGPLSVDPVE
jgi:hypothetical protein